MGRLVALLVWGVAAMTVWFCLPSNYWMPTPVFSEAAAAYDGQFMLTLIITGVAFVAAQLLLGLFIFQYREGRKGAATYSHGNTLVEVGGTIATAVVFVGLAIAGQQIWAQVHLSESPADALRIEVTGQQFQWNIRYPGPDGEFGETRPDLYEKIGNLVGIDSEDPAGRDDFISLNRLVVPVNRPVHLILRSKDVLHSFFLPKLRIKQDTVPGLAIPLRFQANRTGEFEIACAELCGAQHYFMRAFMKVVEPAEFEAWQAEQEPVFGPMVEQEEPVEEAVTASARR